MKNNLSIRNFILRLTISGVLIAVGITIPMFSPLKIILEPASFTLASHVAIFIAIFISPSIAIAVALGTTVGFFFGGFPLIIVFRAASHLIFATAGSFYLKKFINTENSIIKLRIFSFFIALTHAVSEIIVVSFFYFNNRMGENYYQRGFIISVLLLVGLGTVVHSMVDFEIANVVRVALKRAFKNKIKL